MDNSSDDTIRFDSKGYCNYCTDALERKERVYFPDEVGEQKIKGLVQTLKKANKDNKYDCLMGISGGLDSSYLVYLGYKWGLRIACVHVDDGFNSEITKSNLSNLEIATGFDFIYITPDSEQLCALTKAFLKSGVPNIAMPQDNIIFAYVHDFAKKYKIKHFLSGSNYALENILQAGNTHYALDFVNIKDINKKFGAKPLNKLKFLTITDKIISEFSSFSQTVTPLNFVDYRRDKALSELSEFCDFEYYGRKHLENIFTAFTQLYWFPKKFNVDKRTSHLSSMIISNQLTRDEALEISSKEPLYDEMKMNEYIEFIKTKLEIGDDEFCDIMNSDARQHNYYKTDIRLRLMNAAGSKLQRKIKQHYYKR
jgi:N-acetyl sugar amidotransferase